MEQLSIILEITMIILFGISWPFNIVKAYKGKTAKGTSVTFLFLIIVGYAAGIISKFVMSSVEGPSYWSALRVIATVFYFINFTMLAIAIFIYYINKRNDLEKKTN